MSRIGVGYCRVSTDEQVNDGNSLEVQKREITKYCKDNDITLKHIYVEMGVSAYKNTLKDRPQGRFIFSHIVKKDIDCIVSISDDRIFRNGVDSMGVRQIAKKSKIEFLYTRQPFFNSGPAGKMFEDISAIYNEYQSSVTSEKVRLNMIDKVRQGEWNGPAPFGYRLKNKKLEIYEEEANIVKLIYSLYTEQFMGFEAICNHLNSNEIFTDRRRLWSKSTVGDMLKNGSYTGDTYYNKRETEGKGVKFKPKEQWLIITNTHQAIISKETFSKAEEMLSKKVKKMGAKNVDRSAIGKLPLSGLLVCGNCHNIYTGTSNRTDKRGKIYYYMCVSRKRYGKSICDNHMIPADLLEKFVLYRIREVLTSDMYNKHFKEQLEKTLANVRAHKKDMQKVQNNIKKLENDKNTLVELIMEEKSERIRDTYRNKLNMVLEQLEMEENIFSTYNALDIAEEEKMIKKQFELQYDDITYKDFQELSKPQLKLLFNELIDSIEIKELEMSNPEISRKTPVAITINMKITGYSPKYTIDFIKGMKTEEMEKENSQFFFENRELKKGGRGRRTRTLKNGFGDRHVTITSYPYKY